jgi:membrane-associated phospholipid phosphatase
VKAAANLDLLEPPARGFVVARRVLGASAWVSACVALVCLSVAYVDRPVARFVHDELRDGPVAASLARLPETSTLVPELTFAVAAICLLAGMRARRVLGVGATALAAFAVAETIKTELKFAFGRTWPETWTGGNPSFIRDGVYAFVPFHGGSGYASFPSGHMTAAASVMTVAWLLLPRGRPAWALITLLAAAGLLALNYHFVADVIAGFFLGSLVAATIVDLARRLPPRWRP